MSFRKKFRLGWLPNPIDVRDISVDLGGRRRIGTGLEGSLKQHVRHVFNQRNTSSCVAQAIAEGICVRESKAELSVKIPSRLFIYYNSRVFHEGHHSDSGTHIRTAVKGLTKLGAPDEEHWKFSTGIFKVNRRPRWKPYMRGYGRKGGQYHWILSRDDERIIQIKKAIDEGYPVIFGTSIDRSFLQVSNGRPIPKPSDMSAIIGGHAMLIIGYQKTLAGTNFEIVNSWGTGWGNKGFGWMSEDYIRWHKTRDFVIIHGWEKLNV